jgi:hypothetical protein
MQSSGRSNTFVMNKTGQHIIKLLKIVTPAILLVPMALCTLFQVQVHAAGTSVSCLPSSGIAASTTLIMGKGFSGKLATIYWDDRLMAENVPISDEGSFAYTLEIPSDFQGDHTIYIEDDSHWSGSTGSVLFTVAPSLSLYPRSGEAYTPVTIKGEGFAYREGNIKITMDGVTLPRAGFAADEFGIWSVTISIPDSGKGRHVFSAFGDKTTADEIDEIAFIITPWFEIEPQSGPAGTDITVKAWGFVTSEVGISITWDSESIKRGLVARSDGSLEYELNAPESTTGPHIVGIFGRLFSRKGTFPEHTFEIVPAFALEPTSGNKGTEVAIKGTGLKGNEKITIYYNDKNTGLTASTDNNGSLNATFIIPQSDKKVNVIKVSDTQGFSRQAEFTIENLPPSEPYLLAPVSGERISVFDSTYDMLLKGYHLLFDKTYGIDTISFNWSVPPENGTLSYVVQVATDDSFSTLFLNKEIDNDTSYTASATIDGKPFARGYYWWRVKAVDSYGNESPWSDTAELEVITAPLRVMIISSVVVLLFLGAVIVGIMVARALTAR